MNTHWASLSAAGIVLIAVIPDYQQTVTRHKIHVACCDDSHQGGSSECDKTVSGVFDARHPNAVDANTIP